MFQGDPPVTLPIKLPLQVIGTLVHRRHYVGLRTTLQSRANTHWLTINQSKFALAGTYFRGLVGANVLPPKSFNEI